MALIAELNTPYLELGPELVGAQPFGSLSTPHVQGSVPRLSSPISNRFPVPPVAWAFLTLVDAELEFDSVRIVRTGAVFPESTHLEPTIGQIWPR